MNTLASFLSELLDRMLSRLVEEATPFFERIAQVAFTRFVESGALPIAHKAFEAVKPYWFAVLVYFGLAIIFALAGHLPLAWRAISARRRAIFISFHNVREREASTLERCLDASNFEVLRVPYSPHLTHQNVVMSVNALLRRAYAVICLPGSDQSFVESEVAFATASHRTVLFVVPRGGTLPNTADKRHPVFVQELAAARAYAPVTALLHYLVQDLSSTLQLYQRAWSPRVGLFSPKALLLATTLAAIVFFVLTALEAHVATAGLVHTDVPSAEGLRWKVVLTVAALLSIGALLLLLIANVLLLVSRSLWVQFRASRRAALRAQAGEFTRADWVELVPGMQPGDPVYESMYENAPRAHHESGQGSRRRKPWAG